MSYKCSKIIDNVEFRMFEKSIQVVTEFGAEFVYFNSLVTDKEVNVLNRIIQLGVDKKKIEVQRVLKSLIS